MGAYIRVMRYTKNAIILSRITILSRMCNGESQVEKRFNVQEDGKEEANTSWRSQLI